MVRYLEEYAARFDIRPAFNMTVSRIRRDGTRWRATFKSAMFLYVVYDISEYLDVIQLFVVDPFVSCHLATLR
jgi:hypothetical protein